MRCARDLSVRGEFVRFGGVIELRRTYAGRRFTPPQGAYLRLERASQFLVEGETVDELFVPDWPDTRAGGPLRLIGRVEPAEFEFGAKVHVLREAVDELALAWCIHDRLAERPPPLAAPPEGTADWPMFLEQHAHEIELEPRLAIEHTRIYFSDAGRLIARSVIGGELAYYDCGSISSLSRD
jgi:hypothetical protein